MKNILQNCLHIFRKLIWNLKGGYQPKKFWEKWGKTFFNDKYQRGIYEQHEWILKKVRQLRPRNILEVGCGFGRNIKYLAENGYPDKNITGVDISSTMLKKAREFLGNNNCNLIEADAVNLPFGDKQFDLCLVHGVLMHIGPEQITVCLNELLRVCKKYLIISEQNYGGDNDYTFVHDYRMLIKKEGLKILSQRIENKYMDCYLIKV